MATRTSTETKTEITKRGDTVIVKVIETSTIHAPGKEPEIKEVIRIEEFKGEEGFKKLPENIRRQLEQPKTSKSIHQNQNQSQNNLISTNKKAAQDNFAEECLEEHNNYRKIHGAPPLVLSKRLMEVSEKRAKELAAKDEMCSRIDQSYGENLSCLWSSDPDHYVNASEMIAKWYSEHKNYDFSKEPDDLKAGHFTQMVWCGSKEFGVAAVKSNSNRIYVVATYCPPGNYAGEFRNNVKPPGSPLNSKTTSNTKLNHAKTSNASETSVFKIDKNLNKECVAVHNEYRARHGVPPLKFSQEVANYAQEWANKLAERDKLEHRTNGLYGENLYCFKSSDPKETARVADACKNWYDEIQMYDFQSEPKSLATAHFTQMVWKTTEEVGMGMAKSKTGLQIVVVNYNPPGNYIGMFRENVPKPTN